MLDEKKMMNKEPEGLTSNFIDQFISDLRSENTTRFNAAFETLREHSDLVKLYVFRATQQESDPRVLGALIELLGESRDPQFVKYIADQLLSDDPEPRFWAHVALRRIGTPDALEAANCQSALSLVRACCKKDE